MADDDVINCLKLITFVPIEEIEAMEKWSGSELNQAKEILAFEMTKMIHGEEEAIAAQQAARDIFSSSGSSGDMPSTTLSEDDLSNGEINVIDLLQKTGLTASKGEGRRLVQQGGITVNGEKVTDFLFTVSREDLVNGVVIKKGKKVFHKALI